MKKILSIFITLILVLTGSYILWSSYGRTPPPINVQLHIDNSFELNGDSGKGNVVGINAYMMPVDYASSDHFMAKLDGYLSTCNEKGWLNSKTTVIFPEYIGTWLVLEGEKNSSYSAETVDQSLRGFVLSNFFSYIQAWFMAPDVAKDKIKHSVFSMKGQRMANLYTRTFSKLARKYKVTIIAGSILLPNPEVRKNEIITHKGSIENITAVFNPDGSMQPKLTRKAFPIADELSFVRQCPVSEIPVYSLPLGKTAVMICADSWFPEPYQAINQDSLVFIAVPSFTTIDNSMSAKWAGYSGFGAPADVDTMDIGKITLRQAWVKYTMPHRILSTSSKYGMTVSLRGKLWDLGTDGELIVYNRGEVFCPPAMQGASMVNLWIN